MASKNGPATTPGPNNQAVDVGGDIEAAIAALIPSIRQGHDLKPVPDSIYPQIFRLLELGGKHAWSLRPRTYALLRLIGRLDAMTSFVSEGLFDVSLPYNEKTLPDSLNAPRTRHKFLDLQPLILSEQAAGAGGGGGRHRHFGIDGDNYFVQSAE
ncbi:hypothetical protein C7999DRAFT_30347 [Corynascus novoguineensis]|uniref:Uncharacterized protein n=1 Tax=Corynascus novoguineensis TaxID=1126955 RepID=A0AAN7CVJ9_9PEZI|nr:hypothetical protein C7999DRAFT_30347 [Corynascus novoguineensis]